MSSSTAAYKTFGCIGEIANPIFPLFDPGRPLSIFDQLLPPSTLLYKDVPGPPPIRAATFLCFCQLAAYSTSGFVGSITRSVTPVHSLISNVFFQVLPPSVVLNKPLSPPGLHNGPCEATQTVFGSSG